MNIMNNNLLRRFFNSLLMIQRFLVLIFNNRHNATVSYVSYRLPVVTKLILDAFLTMENVKSIFLKL